MATITTTIEVMTVDLLVKSVVLDAASARLPSVQAEERRKYGRARTNLSTLAEEALRTWEPGMTTVQVKFEEAACPHCGRTVRVHATGRLRLHGPKGGKCPETYVNGAPGGPAKRPLRFVMNTEDYSVIRDRIHRTGQSVTSVITQRFAHFARHGSLL